jgi:DNA-binding beta-propeller fold protein YncE
VADLVPGTVVGTSAPADCSVVAVVSTRSRQVYAWDQAGAQRSAGAGNVAAVDPLGKWIAVADSGKLRVLDAHSLAGLWETDRVGALVMALAVDPRGRFLLVGDSQGGVSF